MIGQACEFDYSGTQACRVLKAEGYKVILANSNPATIMTDPDFAHRTYVEPLDVARPASDHREGTPRRDPADARRADRAQPRHEPAAKPARSAPVPHGLIGASIDAIQTAEDREKFKAAMTEIGLAVPASGFAYDTRRGACAWRE